MTKRSGVSMLGRPARQWWLWGWLWLLATTPSATAGMPSARGADHGAATPWCETQMNELSYSPSDVSTATSGQIHVLILAGRYTNTDPFSAAQLQTRLFGGESGYPSITDYFTEVSQGAFSFVGTVRGDDQGALFDLGYTPTSQPGNLGFVNALLAEADEHVDFSQYDFNDNGKVDFVTCVFPGRLLLPYGGLFTRHPYVTDDLDSNGDPVMVDTIAIVPLYSDWPDPNEPSEEYGLIDIGVFAHEWSHYFGLKDQYNCDRRGGFWSVMDAGWKGAAGDTASGVRSDNHRTDGDYTEHSHRPIHLDPQAKLALGWATADTVTEPMTGVQLGPMVTTGDMLLVESGNPGEHWLLEYRKRTDDTFDQDIPASGLAIWHVHGICAHIEEADGDDRLNNNLLFGDKGDLFPGSEGQEVFNDSLPSAYVCGNSPRTANSRTITGEWTGFTVSNITLAPDSAYVTFDIVPAASPPPGGVTCVSGGSSPPPAWVSTNTMTATAESYFRSVAIADYDDDGRADIYQAAGKKIVALEEGFQTINGPDRVWSQTEPNTFSATGSFSADAFDTRSVSWSDYDNDGDLDVFIVNAQTNESTPPANRLFRNDGSSFTQMQSTLGVGQGGSGRGSAWLDFDQDGLTDLLLVRSDSVRLFRNAGGSTTWPNEAVARGLVIADGAGATCADYNNDGWMDVFVLRDGGATTPSGALFRNSGPPSFTFTAVGLGMGGSHAAAWGDYDNDGDQDLYVARYAESSGGQQNSLYRNSGAPLWQFSDVAEIAGVRAVGVVRMNAVVWSDVDNDADLDLLVAASDHVHELLNTGPDGSYGFTPGPGIPVSATLGSMGLATGDLDGDGSADYAVNDAGSNTYVIERADPDANHWLQVRLVGAGGAVSGCYSNRSAIGARVRVVSGGVSQWRQVEGGLGSGSQNSLTLQFGLRSATTVELVEVTWPSGIVQPVSTPVDTMVTVTEPSTFHGTISQNTTWSGCITVDGDVKINTGVTLTIAAGTDVRFATTDAANLGSFSSQCELIVYGTLDVNGTSALPVTLASIATSPTEHDWAGIIGYGDIQLDHVEMRHAEWGVSASEALVVENSLFESNQNADLRLYGDDAEVSNSTFHAGGGGSIEVMASGAALSANTITGDTTSTFGVKVGSSTAGGTFDGNTISGLSNGYGIWLETGSSTVTGNQISGCHNAVRVANGTHTIGASGNGNDLSGGYYGIYAACTGPGSCPSGCTMAVTVRHNAIHGNTVGVNVRKTYAGVDLGTATSLGYNSIVDNSLYCIQNSSTCGTVSARGNYLGECDPLPPLCTDGAVDFADYLCSEPTNIRPGTEVDVPAMAPPQATVLLANVPNPFSPETRVRFLLAHQSPVVLEILDAAGRRVERANLGTLPPGEHSWVWRGRSQNGAPLPGGIYFTRLRAGDVVKDRKMIMLK